MANHTGFFKKGGSDLAGPALITYVSPDSSGQGPTGQLRRNGGAESPKNVVMARGLFVPAHWTLGLTTDDEVTISWEA